MQVKNLCQLHAVQAGVVPQGVLPQMGHHALLTLLLWSKEGPKAASVSIAG